MKVEQLSLANYNKISNIPVINQDLSASGFTPVANTYYRHTGTTGTYTQGVIYYYDGTEYKALDGSGGGGSISDVKVAGTSVVTDGVANIPVASTSANGVVTTSTQTFFGEKTFNPTGRLVPAGVVITGNGNYTYIKPVSSSTAYYVFLGSHDHKFQSLHCNNGVFYQSVKTNVISRQDDGTKTINVPPIQGTILVAPSTWSSGLSNVITLTEAGTYQIRAYDETEGNFIDFGLVYVGLDKETRKGIVYDASTAYRIIIGSDGIINAKKDDLSNNTSSTQPLTIDYRRVGI